MVIQMNSSEDLSDKVTDTKKKVKFLAKKKVNTFKQID